METLHQFLHLKEITAVQVQQPEYTQLVVAVAQQQLAEQDYLVHRQVEMAVQVQQQVLQEVLKVFQAVAEEVLL